MKRKYANMKGKGLLELLDSCDKAPFVILKSVWVLTSFLKTVVAYAESKGVSFDTEEFDDLFNRITNEQKYDG